MDNRSGASTDPTHAMFAGAPVNCEGSVAGCPAQLPSQGVLTGREGLVEIVEGVNPIQFRALERFDRCLASEQYGARIDADTAVAARREVMGTPTWVVQDSVDGGMPSVDQLEQWIQRAGKGR